MMYDANIYNKYSVIHHYETLLKDPCVCAWAKVVSRCYTLPLLIIQGP